MRAQNGPWVLAATILGSSTAFVDGTVVNIALPVLQQELGANASEAQWVVQAYSLMLASLILVGAALALGASVCAWLSGEPANWLGIKSCVMTY